MAVYAFALLIGGAAGLLAVFDLPISWSLSRLIPLEIQGTGLFELYPYEVSSLFFAFLLFFYLIRNVPKGLLLEKERYYIIAVLFTYVTFSLHKLGPIDVSDLVVFFSFISFGVAASINGEKMTFQSLDVLNLILLMALVISAVNAGGAGIFILLNGFLKGAKVVLFSFLLVNSVIKTGPRLFIRWLLIFTTLSAVVGILQEVAYISSHTLIMGLVESKDIKYMFDSFMGVNIFRVPAFTSGYKFFSALLIFGIIIEFNLLLYHKMKKKTMVLIFVSLFLMCSALFFTFSKDSWLLCFVAIAVSLFLRWPICLIYFIIISLLAVALVAYTHILDDLMDSLSASLKWGEYRIRIQLARDGIHGFISRHLLIGGGVRRAPLYVGNFNGWPPHNVLITAADETGLFGLSVYILFALFTLYKCVLWTFSAKDGYNMAVSRGMLFCFVTYILLMQFEPGFLDITLWMLMGFIHAMAILQKNMRYDLTQNILKI